LRSVAIPDRSISLIGSSVLPIGTEHSVPVTNWTVIPLFFSSTFHEIAASKFDNPSRRHNQDENLRKAKH
jgi:hypothetical protein